MSINQIGNCDLPSKLFDSGQLTHLLPLTIYPLKEKTLDNNKLIASLRNDAAARVIWTPSFGSLATAAADALEAAQAEIERLKGTASASQVISGLNGMLEDKHRQIESLHKEVMAVQASRNAALARLAELEKQEPVAASGEDLKIYQSIAANYHAAAAGASPACESKSTENSTQTTLSINSDSQSGASPQPVYPSNDELEKLWHESHCGHPADFAADVLERWGGAPAGLMGHGGKLDQQSKAVAQPSQALDLTDGEIGKLINYAFYPGMEPFASHYTHFARAIIAAINAKGDGS